MEKKVLVIYYTQSGQLGQIVDQFTIPFENAGISVEKVLVKPAQDFAFPWTADRFFDAMPESVLGIPTVLAPFSLKESSYDLIVFAYQPWYLSPAIPANSILYHPVFQQVLKNTPVVTVIGARNMWLQSQEKVRKGLQAAGAKLVGNIALVDRNNNSISAVTILYWMLTGKKDRLWGRFPKPGVSDEDIKGCSKFGGLVCQRLINNDWAGLQPALINEKAVVVKSNLMFIESRAIKLFSIWANLIIKRKNRRAWLVVFKYYLLIALFMVAPVVLLINNLLFRPFLGKQIAKKKQYYLEVN